MDIYCRRCKEPWDMDSLHDAAASVPGATFDQIRSDFYAVGCAAIDTAWETGQRATAPNCEAIHDATTAGLGVLQELLGDDVDGLAALSEDFGFAGLLDL